MNGRIACGLIALLLVATACPGELVAPDEEEPQPPSVTIDSVVFDEPGLYIARVSASATAYDGTSIEQWTYRIDELPEHTPCIARAECSFVINYLEEHHGSVHVTATDSKGRATTVREDITVEVPRARYDIEPLDLGPGAVVTAVAPSGSLVGLRSGTDTDSIGFLLHQGAVHELNPGVSPMAVNSAGAVLARIDSHPECEGRTAGVLVTFGKETVYACNPAASEITEDGTIAYVFANQRDRVHHWRDGEVVRTTSTGLASEGWVFAVAVGSDGTLALDLGAGFHYDPALSVWVVPPGGSPYGLCMDCSLAGVDAQGRVTAGTYHVTRTGPRQQRMPTFVRGSHDGTVHTLAILHFNDRFWFPAVANATGTVIGGPGNRGHMYRWDGSTARIEIDDSLEGWKSAFKWPAGIDDQGRIVVNARAEGESRAYRLTPVPD